MSPGGAAMLPAGLSKTSGGLGTNDPGEGNTWSSKNG